MRLRRGLSLVEILVASGLFLVLGSLVITFFLSLTRSSSRGLAKAASEQRAVRIFNHLVEDLQTTTSSAISWQPDLGLSHRKALAIQPINTVSNEGRLVYSSTRLICYFWDPTTYALTRREWTTTAPSVAVLDQSIPQRCGTVQLTALQTASGAQDTAYGSVTDFDLGSATAPPNISSPLHPTLLVEIQNMQDLITQVDHYRLNRIVVLNDSQGQGGSP